MRLLSDTPATDSLHHKEFVPEALDRPLTEYVCLCANIYRTANEIYPRALNQFKLPGFTAYWLAGLSCWLPDP